MTRMNLGIDYAVLRTHARIAELLNKKQIQYLAEADGIDEFLERLKDTPYGEVEVKRDDKIALNLEKVFVKKFIERIEEIVKITPTEMGIFLQAYFNLRFEILNIKRILRGKFTQAKVEEITESLIPIEPYLIRDYEPLINAASLEDAVKALDGVIYESLIDRLELYKRHDALWPLELELNYIYARHILRLTQKLPSKDRHIVNSLVKYETDIENILIAIKRRGKPDIDIDSLFPVTYGVRKEELKAFIEEEDLNKAIDKLEEPYRSVLDPIKRGDVALVRAMLRKGKYEAATRARAGNQFGFNVILAFLVYSEIEKDNLVGLSWGEVQGLSPEQLLKYIVIPWD